MNFIPSECSFCGKGESEVEFLLPGLGTAAICSSCIEQSSEFRTNMDAAASCGFCGREQNEVSKLLSGENASVCRDCILALSSPPSVLTRSGFVISPGSRIGSWLLNSKNHLIRKYVLGE